MPLAVIGAVVAEVGSVAGAAISAGANTHAANVAAANNAANNALSESQYNSTKALVQPYVDKGNAAGDELQGFLGLGGDPAATQKAFDTYLNSTGYAFDKSQGLDAVNQSAASQGLFNSGAALKSLNAFGTGEAQKYGQNYIDNLNTVANRGTNAITALTGAGNTNVTNQTANNNAGTTAAANAITANGSLGSGLINSLTGIAGKAIGGSSFGGGNPVSSANAFNQPGYAPFYTGG